MNKDILKFTLQWEGGDRYTNDSQDPGGETKFGISKRAYPKEDIKNLTLERASELYERDYWFKAGCDGLPVRLAACVFDAAVNCGVSRAVSWDMTTVEGYNHDRREYYEKLVEKKPTLKKFLKGWLNRVDALDKFIATLH